MSRIGNLSDYLSWARSCCYAHCEGGQGVVRDRLQLYGTLENTKARQRGWIGTEPGLTLKGGLFIKFKELVEVTNGRATVQRYSYECYLSDDDDVQNQVFRYEYDPGHHRNHDVTHNQFHVHPFGERNVRLLTGQASIKWLVEFATAEAVNLGEAGRRVLQRS